MSRIKKMMDQLPTGVALTSIDGQIIEVNQEVVRMLGFETKDELLNVRLQDLYARPEQREEMLDALGNGRVQGTVDLLVQGEPVRFGVDAVLFSNSRYDLILTAIWRE